MTTKQILTIVEDDEIGLKGKVDSYEGGSRVGSEGLPLDEYTRMRDVLARLMAERPVDSVPLTHVDLSLKDSSNKAAKKPSRKR